MQILENEGTPLGYNFMNYAQLFFGGVYGYAGLFEHATVKPVLNGHSKRRPKNGFQDQLMLNAGQKYCRMLQGEWPLKLLKMRLPVFVKASRIQFYELCFNSYFFFLVTFTNMLAYLNMLQ